MNIYVMICNDIVVHASQTFTNPLRDFFTRVKTGEICWNRLAGSNVRIRVYPGKLGCLQLLDVPCSEWIVNGLV